MLAMGVIGMVPHGMVVWYGGIFSLNLAGSIAEHVRVVTGHCAASSNAPAVEVNAGVRKCVCRV